MKHGRTVHHISNIAAMRLQAKYVCTCFRNYSLCILRWSSSALHCVKQTWYPSAQLQKMVYSKHLCQTTLNLAKSFYVSAVPTLIYPGLVKPNWKSLPQISRISHLFAVNVWSNSSVNMLSYLSLYGKIIQNRTQQNTFLFFFFVLNELLDPTLNAFPPVSTPGGPNKHSISVLFWTKYV